MGIQFNYFAASNDLQIVAGCIYAWSNPLVRFPERAPRGELEGTAVTRLDDLVPQYVDEIHLLCPAELVDKVVVANVDSDLECIRVNENPVVEYSPSFPVETDVIKIGRLFVGHDDAYFKTKVLSLVAELKKYSTRIDNSDTWVFPQARKTARLLRPWVGKDWKYPIHPEDR